MKLRPSDLHRLGFVADPRMAPDGNTAVATVTHIVPGDDDGTPPRYRSRVHRIDLQTHERVELTAGDGNDTHPRYDATGARLAFLRTPAGDPGQVHVLPLAGGEAQPATAREAGVTAFAWHPDAPILALLSPARKEPPHDEGRPYRATRSRHQQEGMGLLPEVATEVLLLDVSGLERGAAPDGPPEPRVVCRHDFGASQLDFAPDGATLYVKAYADDAGHAELRANLFAVDLDDPEPRPLLPRAMQIQSFAVDPFRGDLCFLAPVDATAASAPTGLWRVPATGGEPELLSGDLEAAPSVAGDSRHGALPATPIPDGEGWVCAVNERGRSNLARLHADGTRTSLTKGDRVVTAHDGRGGAWVFTAETPDRPGELFLRAADGSEARSTDVNDALVADARFATPTDAISVRREDGAEVGYWRVEPTEPREDRAVVVQVHGGPAANYGYGFMFEFQLLASAGYTVVYGNPRGGSSFGLPFASAIQGGYGTVDADDVMAIVEHALAAHPAPDAPVHLTGGSYGGFMTNWLIGRTHRFRSAVTQRSICNFVSFYGTSDIGPWFAERELGSDPWTDLEALWRQSPLRNAPEIRTPLLILHAEDDRRCPIEQGEQLYAALKRLGRVSTELVRFPGEGHELSRSGRPDRRVARLEAILDWFARYA